MSATFQNILQQVTQEKLEELKVQRDLMTTHFKEPLKSVENSEQAPREKLETLYNAAVNCPVQETFDYVLLENLKYVLQNSKRDPSISPQLLEAWTEKLKHEIQFNLRKCEYSYLYGSLLSEWLQIEETKRRQAEAEAVSGSTEDNTKSKESKEKVIKGLETIVFSKPEDFNAESFRNFLSKELFDFQEDPEGEIILLSIIKETKDFFKPKDSYISSYDLQCCIDGLTFGDLLSQDKKAGLKELKDNPEALEEVATLLSNRLRNLQRWKWPDNISKDVTEIRRGLSGQYRPYLNEDILTALLLQHIGVIWASYFKRQFSRILDSRIWKKQDCKPRSIEAKRREFYRSTFLASLPDSMESQRPFDQDKYAKLEAAEDACVAYDYHAAPRAMLCAAAPEPQMENALFGGAATKSMMRGARKVPAKICPPPPPQKPDIDFKESFLHMLFTEIKLHQVLNKDKILTVVQAELESFEPSVIHEAALVALEFLGVDKSWLEFFKKFMQPEIRFDASGNSKKVERGVPASHVLSSLLGEIQLFLLDFLVNRKCDGMRIFRLSDEVWFWGTNKEHVLKAWETIQTFGKMVGLKTNENRSGSVSVILDEEKAKQQDKIVCGVKPLPQKNIHWGYLELQSNGIFKIDQTALKKFVSEMKDLLQKSGCVLEWINIFNKYFTFFKHNFGKSAIASGSQHLDQIIEALRLVYVEVFGSTEASPVAKLKEIFEKLRSLNIVDAWAYWPLERGGLGLVNPFISTMALKETYVDLNEDDYFKKLPVEDKILWEEMKKQHEKNYGTGPGEQVFKGPGRMVSPKVPKLPTWEEYVASRETDLSHWYHKYLRLLERPPPKSPVVSDKIHIMGIPLPEDPVENNYMMWLFSYYETQLLLHFGNVQFINSKLLPMSMIASIQKTKVKD